jgi:hypothetical protein
MTDIAFEYTDTFGGESNYSWVRRGSYKGKRPESRLSVVRAAKQFAGISGVQSRVEDTGDLIIVRPFGICTVLFITYQY